MLRPIQYLVIIYFYKVDIFHTTIINFANLQTLYLFDLYHVLHELGGSHLCSYRKTFITEHTSYHRFLLLFWDKYTAWRECFHFAGYEYRLSLGGQYSWTWHGVGRGEGSITVHGDRPYINPVSLHQDASCRSQLNLLDFCTGVGIRLANINSSQITQMRTNCKQSCLQPVQLGLHK